VTTDKPDLGGNLVHIEVWLNRDEIPEWLPDDMAAEFVQKIREAGDEFTQRAEALQREYEKKLRDMHDGCIVLRFLGGRR